MRPLTYYSIESGDTLHLRIEFQITIEMMSGDTFFMEVDGCDQIGIVKLMTGYEASVICQQPKDEQTIPLTLLFGCLSIVRMYMFQDLLIKTNACG